MTQPENAAQADIARLVSEINANPDNWQAYADLVAVWLPRKILWKLKN